MDRMEMLDKYLEGEMSVDESRSFEHLLDRDHDLAKELQLHKDMARAILNDGANDFTQMLGNAHKQYERKLNQPVFYRAAAVFALFLTVGGVMLMLNGRTGKMKRLAEDNYQLYQSFKDVRSGDANDNSIMSKALEFYNKSDYFNASRYFEQVLTADPTNNQARFYLAISLMENKQEFEAIRRFKQIADQKDVLFLNQSEWYLSICYLRLGRKEEAILPLERLAKKKGYYQDQAVRMLRELKEN